jgi:hypothetical protein
VGLDLKRTGGGADMDPKKPYATYADALAFATAEINKIDPNYSTNFLKILEFCFKYVEDAGGLHASKPKLSQKWIETKAEKFVVERYTAKPSPTLNIPDPLIGIISEEYFGIDSIDIENLLNHHKVAMAAENVTGSLLEEYIATVMEPLGWIWCSGKMVKASDFIKFPVAKTDKPHLLQVKNRSNSENSSSSSIRIGTTIDKWYRLEAETGATRWDNFPDPQGKKSLSEAKFQEFVKDRIAEWNI